ncbi:DNA primase [Burkholderia phage BcepNY3]|uniref:DNA primase n=1 Tax=Burkholderia phage BcepNY3 TaxID=2881397 RepID=A6N3G1_9CAUD|nr:DNA primase [Burkholderia phage BcepNY3]ABR10588.1 DNA primase [Burkholderia phage BcepNY3]
MQIQFAQVTATNCELTKTFQIGHNGQLDSSAIAHMTEGFARIRAIEDVGQLRGVLEALTPHDAITCGIPQRGDTPLTTRAGAEFRRDAVARTNEAFTYPYGAALFPIDVDVEGDAFQSVAAVLDALESASPWLRDVHRVARPSSSSYVGARGLRGVHVYCGVTNGADIPALAKRMQIEQWAAGHGHVKISRSGALLVRQLADALVYQPSRLMFESSPVLHDVTRDIPPDQAFVERAPDPLAGRPGAWRLNGLLDVGKLPRLREIDERRFVTQAKQAKDAKRRDAKRIAIEYQTQNAIASGLEPEAGERFGLLAIRALGDAKLPASWEVHVKDIGRVTVANILDALPASLGFQCADPFDTWRPDLDAKHFGKAEIVMLNGLPGIWSHKLQQFFAFDADPAADLGTPLAMAAEKLCGLIEYPESSKRAAPFVNVMHALKCLFDEIDARATVHAATGEMRLEGVPPEAELIDALSRVGCAGVTPATVKTAIETLAASNFVDPWRDAMIALPQWDGTQRLDTFFVDLCDALPSDALTATTQLLFAGIVKRQLQPGAPLPVVPVLIGPGGTGKSYFVEQLAAALKFPQPPALAFTDTIRMTMEAATSGIAELAEMSGMGRRETEEIKLWTTDTSDTYRAPYERRPSAHPRRFALIGTANKHETNHDATGNRRFMPVFVNRPIDPNWHVEALQLFAEAKARFVEPDGEYARLVRRASALVKEYNDADMRDGIGMPITDLDDILPPVLRALHRQHGPRIPSAELRAMLDRTPSGRQAHARAIAGWLLTRGWQPIRSAAARFYDAPQAFIDNLIDEKINSALNSTSSPFNTP